ncbi:conserved protein of unknown function [uncultured Woeseiaceae bacterium]|uniref:Aminopeptidase n=1 Tax=uncultured Woeseiaceae bacterium TaxID=1983305 RepID=A0A7D9H7T3_9GAMM|nr:conserved protein of unknown function [uncultured Woeseiaceae bacterium]
MANEITGEWMYDQLSELFPICRSITGNGVRQTFDILRRTLPELQIHEIPSGTLCFDWCIPPEWNIHDAYVIDPDGNKILEFQNNNLHILNYSIPYAGEVSLKVLKKHLYSIPDKPHAIPYVTSYYERRWGFCIADEELKQLKSGMYRVFIDSTLEPGHLTYGDLILPGDSEKEIFISTYTCHPSMANNETSGITVAAALGKYLADKKNRRFTYRFVFAPESIGAIAYLSRHLETLRQKVIAGFNVTCVGDDGTYTYLPSRSGNTLADQAALHVLKHIYPEFKKCTYLDRGSDECQYCSPGVDLPFVSIMRTRYGDYPEYHTSKDDLDIVSPQGLFGAFNAIRHAIECVEYNQIISSKVIGEPQFSKHDLRSSLGVGTNGLSQYYQDISDIMAHSDGKSDLIEISEKLNRPMWQLLDIVNMLKEKGLLSSRCVN